MTSFQLGAMLWAFLAIRRAHAKVEPVACDIGGIFRNWISLKFKDRIAPHVNFFQKLQIGFLQQKRSGTGKAGKTKNMVEDRLF